MHEVRRLTADDVPAAWDLERLTFGGPRDAPANWPDLLPGRDLWGVVDTRGRMVAKAVDRVQAQWFGGRLVPTSGVAGVAVAPDLRGRGLARRVLTRVLAAARDRGAVISTLFDSGPGPYRRLGWEEVGAITWRTVPLVAVGAIARPEGVRLRPAGEPDVAAVLELYRATASAGNGLIDRAAPIFDTSPAAVVAGVHGLVLAEDDRGDPVGYVSWDHEPGLSGSGRLTVYDLIGKTPAATAALLNMLGTFVPVTSTVDLRLPDPDPVWFHLSAATGAVRLRQPWMLRIVDAAAAVAARGWPPLLDGTVDLDLTDDVCPWNAGPHRLVLHGGTGRLEPGGAGSVHLNSRGLALLYAGAADPALLRRAGFLTGGNPGTDAFLAAASAGPAPVLLDKF